MKLKIDSVFNIGDILGVDNYRDYNDHRQPEYKKYKVIDIRLRSKNGLIIEYLLEKSDDRTRAWREESEISTFQVM